MEQFGSYRKKSKTSPLRRARLCEDEDARYKNEACRIEAKAQIGLVGKRQCSSDSPNIMQITTGASAAGRLLDLSHEIIWYSVRA